MQPATRTNLTDSAADSLRAEIVSGRWAVGERIPNEMALTDLLSVSRGTVREAVRALVSQGLLDTRQGSGTYVRSAVDPSAVLDRVKRAGLRDQWETRAALDAEAAVKNGSAVITIDVPTGSLGEFEVMETVSKYHAVSFGRQESVPDPV